MSQKKVGIRLFLFGCVLTILSVLLALNGVFGTVTIVTAFFAGALKTLGIMQLRESKHP